MGMPKGVDRTGGDEVAPEGLDRWVHATGYALARTAIYGVRHPASRAAIHIAFQETRRLLALVKRLRCSLQDRQLFVQSAPVDASLGDLLGRALQRHHVPGFELHEPLRESDFDRFVQLLADPRPETLRCGGFLDAVATESIRCISPLPTAAGRPATAAEAQESQPPGPAPGAHRRPAASRHPAVGPLPDEAATSSRRTAVPAAGEVVALDTEMTLEEVVAALQAPATAAASTSPAPPAAGGWSCFDPQLARGLMDAVRMLQAGIRLHPRTSTDPLQAVRDRMSASSRSAAERLAELARLLRTDLEAVAQLEADMTARGTPMALTRSRLMEKLAELIQEVLQPLTAAAGVVDMLTGGHLGPVAPAQSELLAVAAESIQQVATLARHMKDLVGNPSGTTPDEAILKAAYESRTEEP